MAGSMTGRSESEPMMIEIRGLGEEKGPLGAVRRGEWGRRERRVGEGGASRYMGGSASTNSAILVRTSSSEVPRTVMCPILRPLRQPLLP